MKYFILSICAISILNSQQALSAAAEAEEGSIRCASPKSPAYDPENFPFAASPKSPSYDSEQDRDAMSEGPAYSIISEGGTGEAAATPSRRRKSRWESEEAMHERLKAEGLHTPLLSSSGAAAAGTSESPGSSGVGSPGISVAGSPGFSARKSRWGLTPAEAERRKGVIIAIAKERAKASEVAKSLAAARSAADSGHPVWGFQPPKAPPALFLPPTTVRKSRRNPRHISFKDGFLPRDIGAVSRTPCLINGKTFIHRESAGVLFIGSTTYEVDNGIVTAVITGGKENLPYGYSVHTFIRHKLNKIKRNDEEREKIRRVRAARLQANRIKAVTALSHGHH